MNEDKLGGYSTTKNNVLGSYGVGPCWCGESYFVDPNDGLARVVSSGSNHVEVWKLQTSPKPTLTRVAQSNAIVTGQSGGFFTSVSSNGNSNPIIWALSRPVSANSTSSVLHAFNPEAAGGMTQIFRYVTGPWPYYNGDLNQVPVVANGKVYVATYKELQIFGLKPAKQGSK
jgi:hypothetical protein